MVLAGSESVSDDAASGKGGCGASGPGVSVVAVWLEPERDRLVLVVALMKKSVAAAMLMATRATCEGAG